MSEPNRTIMNWCGVWDAEGDYIKGDCVYCEGSTYVAKEDPTTGVSPGTYAVAWLKI